MADQSIWEQDDEREKEVTTYFFEICYLGGRRGQSLQTHKEDGDFPGDKAAYRHFLKLLDERPVGGYYYLCKWGPIDMGARR